MMIQIAAATVGSLGFAIFLKMRGRQIALAGLGGAVTWAVCLICQQYIEGKFYPLFYSVHICGYICRSDGQSQQSAGHHIPDGCRRSADTGRKPVLYYGRPRKRRRVHARRKRQRRGDHSLGYFPGVCSSIRHHQIYKSFPGQKSLVITFPKK